MGRDDRAGTMPPDAGHVPFGVPDQQTDRWTFTPTTWPRANR